MRADPKENSRTFYQRIGKPAFDLTIGLFLSAVTFPALVILLVLAWIGFGWPPLVRVRRVGRKGRPFSLYRVNTRKDHRTDLRGRRLRLSLWLRRTSLDELPQLWNVMLGRMSLVGPRPLPPLDAAELDTPVPRRRQIARPGLTGPWQVFARGDGRDLSNHLDVDLAYVESITFRRDLAILASTLPAVLRYREDA